MRSSYRTWLFIPLRTFGISYNMQCNLIKNLSLPPKPQNKEMVTIHSEILLLKPGCSQLIPKVNLYKRLKNHEFPLCNFNITMLKRFLMLTNYVKNTLHILNLNFF